MSYGEDSKERQALIDWLDEFNAKRKEEYNSFLYGRSDQSPLNIEAVQS